MSNIKDSKQVRKYVQERYGQVAENRKSGCGCCSSPQSMEIQIGYSKNEIESLPEDAALGLGCGNPNAFAEIQAGETVLDLGSGGGIDCFLASTKVGESGKVIGVDMTQKMIDLARKNASDGDYTNVEFRLGEIEKLPVEDDSIDLIISNCVVNLAPDKLAVFKEALRVLRPGGRIIISDLVTDGEIPEDVRKSFEAWAQCIAGAQIKEKYLEIIHQAGFEKVVVEKEQKYTEDHLTDELRGKILSISVKAFKPAS